MPDMQRRGGLGRHAAGDAVLPLLSRALHSALDGSKRLVPGVSRSARLGQTTGPAPDGRRRRRRFAGEAGGTDGGGGGALKETCGQEGRGGDVMSSNLCVFL